MNNRADARRHEQRQANRRSAVSVKSSETRRIGLRSIKTEEMTSLQLEASKGVSGPC